MNSIQEMWQVFVGDELLMKESGLLIGQILHDINVIYVSNIVFDGHSLAVSGQKIIGKWTCHQVEQIEPTKQHFDIHLGDISVHIIKNLFGNIITSVVENGQHISSSCVVFDKKIFLESYFIQQIYGTKQDQDLMCRLYRIVENDEKSYCSLHQKNFQKQSLFYTASTSVFGLIHVLNCILDNRFLKNHQFLKQIVHIPAITQDICRKCSLTEFFQDKSLQKTSMMCKNSSSRQILDTCIGLMVMLLLMSSDATQHIADMILSWADLTADELTRLINWLMGAPAGLKLNRQLTQCLGYIFIYHIYLWKGYLFLLQPILGKLLWYSSVVGVLGVTAQISLMQDILSVMTLHVYCFYVYAARLYRLQVYTLSALWRLFRGRKWNILRSRVDSTLFDVDQLFIGTLMFTVLLFLLPTTTLYYVVFTILRSLVLVVQGVMSKIVSLLNNLPVYSLMLWLVRSDKIKCDILFYVVASDKDDGDHYFAMELLTPALSKVIDLSKISSASTGRQTYSWPDFFINLVKGHLVYPWMSD